MILFSALGLGITARLTAETADRLWVQPHGFDTRGCVTASVFVSDQCCLKVQRNCWEPVRT